ncbi:MAG: sigma 54-interacting transcriptional regulator, partial [Polyangiaceae bacterium]|nr:sigma 54-interacting transcriptional regulator [Polyangiaceae bacterium]
RTVEVGEVRRIGGVEPTAIDVRFVCATNRPIIDMVREGSFREDLYYRLNGTSIEIPPLRRRRREIIPLAEQFLSNIAQRQNRAGLQLTPDAREALSAHAWPGNVRELLNVIERAAALCQACEIRPDDLALGGALPMDGVHTQELPTGVAMSGRPGDWRQRSFPAGMQSREAPTGAAMAVPSGDWRQWDSARGIQSQEAPTASAMAVPPGDWRQRGPTRGSVSSSAPKGPLPSEVAELAGNLERNKIVAALEETAGNQTRTAKLLGISRRTLINKMLRYGIQRPRGI